MFVWTKVSSEGTVFDSFVPWSIVIPPEVIILFSFVSPMFLISHVTC